MSGYIFRANAENERISLERLFDFLNGGRMRMKKENYTPGGKGHGI